MIAARAITAAITLAVLMLGSAPALSAPTPTPAQIKHLEAKLRLMLSDVAHKNEQAEVTLTPDAGGLKTIVRVRVHPSVDGQLRNDITKQVNEYIAIHQGDCRSNTSMRGTSQFPLKPIVNGSSETIVQYPISTLTGHGDIVTTRMPDGTVVNCGKV